MICFVMNFYDEPYKLVFDAVDALAQHYPDAEAKRLVCVDKPRLKLPEFAGRWTERWMKKALESKADVIIKLDPDTRCYGRIVIPDADVFGQIVPWKAFHDEVDTPWGACVGFKRSAIEKIVESGMLLDEKYTDWRLYSADRGEERISLQDPIIADVIKRLGLSFAEIPGLYIKATGQRFGVMPEGTKFAHPIE